MPMVLSFDEVSYRYSGSDTWALKNLDLTISRGEAVLITGASGSGKSSFCRAAIGLIPHFHRGEFLGSVTVDNLDTRENPVYKIFGHAGMLFQNPDAQLFNRTVEEEIVFGLESLGLTSAEMGERLEWASSVAGISKLLAREPHTLSGGEKQRVALASILALRPKVLLLDEPFTHLDAETTEELCALLRTLRDEGFTIIVVEHRVQEFLSESSRLSILHQGRLALDGSPRDVLRKDIALYGLGVPPLVRFFRHSRWPTVPLTVMEAAHWLKEQGLELKDSVQTRERGQPSSSPNRGQPVVEMENVFFSYDKVPVLRHILLQLSRGECVALLGRNGAGKTTLIKHLNGLLKPQRGHVRVLGHDTARTSVAKLARHVGFVWQNPNDQLFQPTVRDEVLTGPRVLKAYDSAWCKLLFERFELGPLLDRSPFRLSEGEKKRVAFATALSVKPEVLILDEPTAGQDEFFRRELIALIQELRNEGKTVLLVTHDIEFAAVTANRWIVLAEGEIVADERPEVIMRDKRAMERGGLRPTRLFQLLEAMKDLKGGSDGEKASL